MSDQTPQGKQVSAREMIGSIAQSPFRLSLVAVACVFLATVLPFIGVRVDIGFGRGSSSLSGAEAAGWLAWLALIVFGLAAASRRVASLQPYKNLLEMGAVSAAVLMALWGWFYNPAAEQMEQANEFIGAFGRPDQSASDMVSQYPHLGMLFLIAAVALVLLARFKDRAGA